MAGRIRVLFVIGSLGGGGAERQTIHYLRHLDRDRFEPLLYVVRAGGELADYVPADVERIVFEQRRTPPRWYFPGRVHRQVVQDLRQTIEHQRVDVLCAVTFFAVLMAGGAVRRTKTPWLAIEMADPRLDFPAQVKRFRGIKQRLLSRAYQHADRAVAVSDGVRDGMAKMFAVPSQQIAVLPNCIDLQEIDRLGAGDSPYPNDGQFHVVTVGRFHAQKGHAVLLEAAKRLISNERRTALRFHLIGQGQLEGELRRFVQDENLDDFVALEGYQPNPIPWIKHADLFCMPSLYEGLPLALLEAMACEVPIIAADCPSGPREVLDGGLYGRLVPPNDARALAEAIADCVDNYDAYASKTAAARRRVRDEYSVAAGTKKLEQLFVDCIERRQ